jgi:two-component system NtrC family sensor kinase
MTTTATDIALSPLALVAEVAARLNAPHDIVRRTGDVLERITAAFGASECSLWLATPNGFLSAACSGTLVTTGSDLPLLLAAEDSGDARVTARSLTSHGRQLGALVLRIDDGIGRDVHTALSSIANMLAPELAWAEKTRHLMTEVERHTQQIETERRFTAHIVDSLPVSLYVIDREYRVKAWNRKRESGSQGVTRENALGRTIFEILHRAPAEKLRREFDEVFRSGRIQQFNMETRATGEVRTYRITKLPMRVTDGEPISHVITIGEDVTDWSTAQDRFAQSEKLAAIGQLAAGVMHEVNNPLATIAACSESLSSRLEEMGGQGIVVPPQTHEFLKLIDGEIDRCKTIIDSLLDFSRPAAREKHPMNVNAAVEQALFLLRHQSRFKRLSIQALLDPGLPDTLGNVEQLVQVFVALLQNAADAVERDGTITIRTRPGLTPQEGIIAEVMDEGHGIQRADLPRIFEPFFTTKEPGRGTGLGLSICYSIISGHEGRIEVDSAVGAGSTFRVILPQVSKP